MGDEFMVLGCDGIWERNSNQEMVDFVRPKIGVKDTEGKVCLHSKICAEICDKGLCSSMDQSQNESFDGTGCDNMTVMVVQLKPEIDATSVKRPADTSVNAEQESKRLKADTNG